MVYTGDTVRIPGLIQFAKDLREISTDFQQELKDANLSAAQIVAKVAVAKAQSQGGVAALAARSIRAVGYQKEGSIRIGGKTRQGRVAFGAEFGSLRFHQFKPYRGNGPDAGYFLWPSIRESADAVAEEYGHKFAVIAQRAFPDGRNQGTN